MGISKLQFAYASIVATFVGFANTLYRRRYIPVISSLLAGWVAADGIMRINKVIRCIERKGMARHALTPVTLERKGAMHRAPTDAKNFSIFNCKTASCCPL